MLGGGGKGAATHIGGTRKGRAERLEVGDSARFGGAEKIPRAGGGGARWGKVHLLAVNRNEVGGGKQKRGQQALHGVGRG